MSTALCPPMKMEIEMKLGLIQACCDSWIFSWCLSEHLSFPFTEGEAWQPQIVLPDGPRYNQIGGIAQSKDLLKKSATGSSAALPLKCHNSGVTDRKKKVRNGFWTKIKVQQQGRSRTAKSLKAHRVRWNPGLCTATNHFRGALVVGSTLVVLHCLVL